MVGVDRPGSIMCALSKIEGGSGNLRSKVMEPHDLRGGGTYESEVRWKYALDPVEMATIYLSRAGND